jgi:hypothetical protein
MKMLSIYVHEIPAMSDYWGRPFRRPLRSGALREAVHGYLAKPKGALLQSLQELFQEPCDLKELGNLQANLFQEGEYAYVFKVSVEAAGGKKTKLAMIVAKNGGGMSRVARLEHENLRKLHARETDDVVRPLGGAYMKIPGQRATLVYAYFTVWLRRFHELGVQHRNMNFYINELPFQYFDARTTDMIKGDILRILFSLYDPVHREAIEPPKVGAGDFVVTRKRPLQLKLVACRKMLKGVSLEGCISLYLGYYGTWGDRLFHFIPADTTILKRAIIEGLVNCHGFSEEEVLSALKRYRDRLARIKPRERAWTPLPSLDKLLSQSWPTS